MAGILGTLIAIYLRVGIDYKRNQGNKLSHSDKTLVQIFHYWVLQVSFFGEKKGHSLTFLAVSVFYLSWLDICCVYCQRCGGKTLLNRKKLVF